MKKKYAILMHYIKYIDIKYDTCFIFNIKIYTNKLEILNEL